MKAPILLMFHDSEYNEIADITFPRARVFAQRSDMEFIGDSVSKIANPWTYKLNLIRGFLFSGVDYVIYADCDVLFSAEGGNCLGGRVFEVSADRHGLCAGFMVIRPTTGTEKLFSAWHKLGECSGEPYGPGQHDQATLKLLNEHFDWVKKLITPIPETVVSNPMSPTRGTLAHHYWANRADKSKIVEQMKADL